MPFITIALLVAAAIGGGTSAAAQGALPGDPLYGFKLGVNEQVRAALSITDKAKADLDVALAEARLTEAAQLAAKGTLSAEAETSLKSGFEARAASVAAHIERLQAAGDYAAAAEVAARFQATVARHASVLAEANAQGEGVKAGLGGILGRVHATLDLASELSAEASSRAAATTGATTTVNNTGANANVQANVNGNTNAQGAGVSGSAGASVDIEI